MDKSLAIFCARQIEAVYADRTLANVLCAGTDTQAYVRGGEPAGDRVVRYVIFPGTASLHDWRTDAEIRKSKWSAGSVHRGFHTAFGSVATEITDMLPANSEVIITGHSLGGALATLFADALNGFRRVAAVITFGSPRVGNGPFARDYNSKLGTRTLRFVNAGDPVPRLPWVFGTYRHVDQLMYLNEAGGVDTNFVVAAAKEVPVRLGAEDAERAQFISVDAHHIHMYRRKLEALA